MTESRDDRIVAEFGEGHAVEDIAARYGLTVAQVYMVVEREVRFDPQPPSPYYTPSYYTPSAPSYPDVDTIVAEYGAGYDIQWIAHKHSISVDWVYYLIHQAVQDGT
ncbi:hypothetical protein GCM10010112_42180 [Actinoplanes lobatus]|uniref:Mor family transcriptional regulator n=1 Tax=Actinoplanes lobatus TaxID=113568 RepID=A0A7W7HN93_9ACTN|nr:Mor transcription activator family protein [Actinoplanes lobatus]MBB4753665.1 Mor family transcriptional regulator [Actinoplanes lobatus]GGN73092.1 hypothetical protein GCM10010112_42180 [Actinoplanes lobatus]GIE44523.1 hypothetical protein Alo02nite_74210 [Actinoplanes lobatus]